MPPAARLSQADAPARPRWKQIAAALRAEIRARVFAEGLLPPEPLVAARFGVHRLTLRQALAALQREGLISIEAGRGTFVRQDVVSYGLGARISFSASLRASGLRPSRRLVEAGAVAAPPEVATALGLAPGTPVVLIAAVGEADGRPLLFGRNHFPAARFPGLIDAFRQTSSFTAALRLYGVEGYARAETRLTTRFPTAAEAALLAQSRDQPVIETRAVDIDDAGAPIAYGITVFAGERVDFTMAQPYRRAGAAARHAARCPGLGAIVHRGAQR